jgi:polyferredoxin
MYVYRKHVIVQLVLFAAFAVMGTDIALGHFVFSEATWYPVVILIVLLMFFAGGLFLYKRRDERTVVITEMEMKLMKGALYGAIAIYLLEMILSGTAEAYRDLIRGTAAGLLVAIAIFGAAIQIRILRPPKEM